MVLNFHHVGLLVDNIETTMESYRGLFGSHGDEFDGPYSISSQGVRVCFLAMAQGYLEFVEPLKGSQILDAMKKRNIRYYHVGYAVKDFDAATSMLTSRGYRHISTFESEAFQFRRCAFLFSPELHLVELIEEGN